MQYRVNAVQVEPSEVTANQCVILRAIRFHTAWAGFANRPLQLRKNEVDAIPFPEWEYDSDAGQCTAVSESVAAYRITLPEKQDPDEIVIEAQFDLVGWDCAMIEVRAQEPSPGDNILGDVAPQRIYLHAGKKVFYPFRLVNVRIATAAVAEHDIIWDWSYRLEGGEWKPLGRSCHTIFTVAGPPTRPWKQYNAPFSVVRGEVDLPWSDALSLACKWSRLARSATEVASQLTLQLYNYGAKDNDPMAHGLHYSQAASFTRDAGMDPVTGILYTGKVLLTEFLSYIKQSSTDPAQVNCSDCATLVCTLANLLGADLAQVTLTTFSGWNGTFCTNPIHRIGTCPKEWKAVSFAFHEVAWGGSIDSDGLVFDACLALNGTDDLATIGRPANAPTPMTAAPLRYGEPFNAGYLFHLVSADARWRIRLGATAQRRPVRDEVRNIQPGEAPEHLFPRGAWAPASWSPPTSLFVQRYDPTKDAPAHWHPYPEPVRVFHARDLYREIRTYWEYQGDGSSGRVRVTAFECATASLARNLLWQQLGWVETLCAVEPPEAAPGEAAFAADDQLYYFVRGNLIFHLQRCGQGGPAISELASALDASLIAPPLAGGRLELEPFEMPPVRAYVGMAVPVRVTLADGSEPATVIVNPRQGSVQRIHGAIALILGPELQQAFTFYGADKDSTTAEATLLINIQTDGIWKWQIR